MLDSASNTWCCFPIVKIHESRNHRGEIETITPRDVAANVSLLIFRSYCSAGLYLLLPGGEIQTLVA